MFSSIVTTALLFTGVSIKSAVGQFNPTAQPNACQSFTSSTEFTTVCGPYGGLVTHQTFNCPGNSFITQMVGDARSAFITAIQFICSNGTTSLYYDTGDGTTPWSFPIQTNGINYVYLRESLLWYIAAIQYDSSFFAGSDTVGTSVHARDNGTGCPLTGIGISDGVLVNSNKYAIGTLQFTFKCPNYAAGTQLTLQKNSCVSCPIGTYKPSPGVYNCIPCNTTSGQICLNSGMTSFSCMSGFTLGNGTCTTCPIGTYKSTNGVSACIPCTSNQHCPNTGMVDFMCPAGFFRENNVCQACPVGTFKPNADFNSTCTSCASPQLCPIVGMTQYFCPKGSQPMNGTCVVCPVGTFKALDDNSTCRSCVAPQNCPFIGISQPICNRGFQLQNGTCVACPINSFKPNDDNSTCLTCAFPRHCPYVNMSQFLCREGYRLVNGTCTMCPANTYKPQADVNVSSSVCTPCILPQLCPEQGMIGFRCRKGFQPRLNNCTACPINTHKDTDDNRTCTSCNTVSNQHCPNTGMDDFMCRGGFYRMNNSCQACPEGTYKSGNTFGSVVSCTRCVEPQLCPNKEMSQYFCPKGRQPANGTCVACPVGTFKSTADASSCQSCSYIQVCPVEGMTTFMCKEGYYRMSYPIGTYEFCTSCPSGTYKPFPDLNVNSSTCTPCQSPQHCPFYGMTRFFCKAGYTLVNGTCVTCPAGTFKSLDDTPNAPLPCTACPAFPYQCPNEGMTKWVCAAGYRFTGSWDNCFPCTAGTYKPTADLNTTCLPCIAPQSCPNMAMTGVWCPSGYFKDPTLNQCRDCPVGTYKPGLDDRSACVGCVSPQVCPIPRLAQFFCEAGYERRNTTTASGSEGGECAPCPPGQYKDQPTSDRCSVCPDHSECTATAFRCLAGYFFNAFLRTCEPCPEGRYKARVGNEEMCPGVCPPGTTSGTGVVSGMAWCNATGLECLLGYEVKESPFSDPNPTAVSGTQGWMVQGTCTPCTEGQVRSESMPKLGLNRCMPCPDNAKLCNTTHLTCPDALQLSVVSTGEEDDLLTCALVSTPLPPPPSPPPANPPPPPPTFLESMSTTLSLLWSGMPWLLCLFALLIVVDVGVVVYIRVQRRRRWRLLEEGGAGGAEMTQLSMDTYVSGHGGNRMNPGSGGRDRRGVSDESRLPRPSLGATSAAGGGGGGGRDPRSTRSSMTEGTLYLSNEATTATPTLSSQGKVSQGVGTGPTWVAEVIRAQKRL